MIKRRLNKEHVIGIILMLIGIVMGVLAMSIRVKKGGTDPGSRLFPLIACGLITLCGLILLITAPKLESKAFIDLAGWKRVAIFMGVMIIYMFALEYLGFIISTPFFLFAVSTMLAGKKKPSLVGRIIYSGAITLACWLIFKFLLKMALPGGMLF